MSSTAIRTLVDPADPKDVEQVHALQDAIKVNQKDAGSFEVPNWDQASQKKVRDALLVLASTIPDFKKAFGTKEEVDPVRHLIGTAAGWGGNPDKDATYLNVTPAKNDGNDRLQAQRQGCAGRRVLVGQRLQRRRATSRRTRYDAYSLNNITAKKSRRRPSRSSSAAATARSRTACRSPRAGTIRSGSIVRVPRS